MAFINGIVTKAEISDLQSSHYRGGAKAISSLLMIGAVLAFVLKSGVAIRVSQTTAL